MNWPVRRQTAGFTLVELLIGMALMGIVMMALLAFFTQGTRISAQSSSRADMQQEVLNAQQLIAGKLKGAWYVYPPLASSTDVWSLTGTNLTKNPVSNNNTWKTAVAITPNQPLLAMILPPDTVGGVYSFIAYYPVKRSDWIGGVTAGSSKDPGVDASNANTWVLAEYRATMPTGFSDVYPPAVPPPMPTGSQSNILSDYVAPTIVTAGFTTAASTYTMFTYTLDSMGTVRGVTLNLATTRQTSGTTLRLPNATDEYTISVFPTNLGKVAVN
ncbi:PilW family protein [Deinococcus arenicola]|uniref:Prepilin-type N-terminal cleavage/methylation domain-containing protein n=1 Tax=Deinococcus arenicola TaxID=2994950 RepID=A0ABU4DR88_9DEIO|nr:prepilin-type N-terminal cleavage/methylation domain-containing protein [Deinococcus sp. ZS9-10]MDV6374594.1 prepilin-type N-terminal cleavage/methylation domain-containing protein [Deinococcus sp. ZS9-10]